MDRMYNTAIPRFTISEQDLNISIILGREVEHVINLLRSNKSPRSDEINQEILNIIDEGNRDLFSNHF